MYSNPAAFVATWAILSLSATAVNPSRKPYQPTGGGDRILTFKETSPESKFSADYLEPSWLPGDEDGLVAYLSDSGSLVLESYATGQNETLVPAKRIPSDYWEYWIRSDQQKVMFSTNYTKQYRHSYFADYQIFDVESGEITPLVEDQAGDIQYATFAPSGPLVAFVRGRSPTMAALTYSTQYLTGCTKRRFSGIVIRSGSHQMHNSWLF